MSDTKEHDPSQIKCAIGGRILQDFGDGTMVKITPKTPRYSSTVGTLGNVTRVKSLDERHDVEFTLMQKGDDNDFMSLLFASGKPVPMLVEDKNGTSLHSAEKLWLVSYADVEYGKEQKERVWKAECSKMRQHVGGGASI